MMMMMMMMMNLVARGQVRTISTCHTRDKRDRWAAGFRPVCDRVTTFVLGRYTEKTIESISDILNTDSDTDVGIYSTEKYRIPTIKYRKCVRYLRQRMQWRS